MKKRILLKIAIVVLLLILSMVVVVSCSNDSSMILGKWLPESSRYSGFPSDLEFFKDGTARGESTSIKWKIEKRQLILSVSESAHISYDYEISKDKLILKNNSGSSETYIRQ